MSGFFTSTEQSGADNWDFGGEPARMPDVMIDIETMGNRPNAPIVAIGAVAFNLVTMELGARYYVNVDLASSIRDGAVPDPSTIMWWMTQSDDARSALTRGRVLDVAVFLGEFAAWLDSATVAERDRKIWACGTDFDVVILAEHYKRAGREVPWRFWNSRDQRTMRELWPQVTKEMVRPGTHHNALDDAAFQAEQLFAIRRHLAGKGKQ